MTLTCKTIHGVFNLNWDFACHSKFYIRIQIPSGGNKNHSVSEEDNEQLYINCSWWSLWVEAWGAALLPWAPTSAACSLSTSLLSSSYTSWPLTAVFSPFLSMQIFFVTPLRFTPPPFSVLVAAACSSTPFFFLCPYVNIPRTHRKALFFSQQTNGAKMEQLL